MLPVLFVRVVILVGLVIIFPRCIFLRPHRYEIEEAERDVVELRRMRRQIRCLFGPNLYQESAGRSGSPWII